MPEYLEDPSVLTKEKLKTELLANNVELPAGGQPAKDVYVRLYLKHLTVQNQRSRAAAVQDTFSSDEELPPPPPPVSNRSRSSSSRKAMRKTVRTEDLDVTELTDENLKDELLKYGFDAGPIVASTRKLYEKKLQKLVDQGPAEAPAPEVVLTQIDIKHNGNSDSDRYSDKEEEITPVPEPEPEPEATPVVERPVRSRGKTPVTLRTHSGLHNRVEKIVAGDQTPRVEERDILKELFPNDLNTPTGISVTCRRPIHGAAARPVKSSDLWSNDSLLHLRTPTASNTTTSSSYTETRSVHRVTSLPPITSRSSSSRLVAAAPPAGQAKAARRGLSLWIKLILLATAVAFLFFVYQAMETDAINPFGGNPQIGGDGAAEQQVVGQ